MRYRQPPDASASPVDASPPTTLPTYAPTISSHTLAAHHGVRRRLLGAAVCGLITAGAAASLLIFSLHSFVFLIVLVIAGGCALITITLAMSARKEEEVHQLAAALMQNPPEPPSLPVKSSTDGHT